jgi:signal transduction histidine kinase
MRINSETFKRLREISHALRTPLADILVTGALMLGSRALNESQYLHAKAIAIGTEVERSESQPAE